MIFGLMTVTTALGKVIDGAFVARRAAKLTLLRQSSLNVLKLPLLLLFFNVDRAFGIVASVVAATGFSLGLALICYLPAVEEAYRPRLRLSKTIIGGILPYAVANHLADLLAQSPQVVLPVLTLNVLGPSDSAYLYVTWMIANLLFVVPRSIATSMVAEGANNEGALLENAKGSLRVIFLLLAPAVILTLVGGDDLLLVFGREYARSGRYLLWILAVSAFPAGVNHVYFAINRVRRRNWRNLVVSLVVAGAIIGSSRLLMTRYGMRGIGIGWLVGQTVLSFFVASSLCRRSRRAHSIGT
jgi:O-antigen/teichoic acid export membrane protein